MTDRSVRGGVAGLAAEPVITIASIRHGPFGGGVVAATSTSFSSGVNPFAANEMLAFPFYLWAPTQISKMFAYIGSAPGNNFSLAIYDADFNRLAQTASTTGSATNAPQAVTLSLKIGPGLFYAVMASDTATTNRYQRFSVATIGAGYWKMAGCWKQASITLGSLPATATPVACTNVAFPMFGLITRTAFDL